MTFLGASVRRLVILAAVVIFFGGQMMGLWDAPSLVKVNVAEPETLVEALAPPTAGAEVWSGGKRSAENATRHFDKHGGEFPFLTEEEYVQAAQDFTSHPPPGTRIVVQEDGDQAYYSPERNFFAVTSPDGKIRTFFRPDPKIHGYKTNDDYFAAQGAR